MSEGRPREPRPGHRPPTRAPRTAEGREGVSIGELLARGRRRLAAAPFGPSTREAALLLSRALGTGETHVLAHPEARIRPEVAATFHTLLDRRCAGEPVAYIFGGREFWGRDFVVDRRVLIPRPETEHLVEAALASVLPANPRILDIGTGCGCLAVTLALESRGARVTATDRSPGALALAAVNARRLGARIRLVAADLAAGLDLSAVDLVVANPPYIDPADAATLSPEVVDHEPHQALFGGQDGLRVIERLLGELHGLPPGARALLEIGRGQAEPVTAIAACDFAVERIRTDLAGIPRVVELRRAPRGGAANDPVP